MANIRKDTKAGAAKRGKTFGKRNGFKNPKNERFDKRSALLDY